MLITFFSIFWIFIVKESSKMFALMIFLSFLIVKVNSVNYMFLCEFSWVEKDLCLKYNFEGACVPWDLSHCEVLDYAFHESRCPEYDCSVSTKIY
jgi:hypothetical protein